MENVVIIGSGAMAEAIAFDLRKYQPRYHITVVDRSAKSLNRFIESAGSDDIRTITGDAEDSPALKEIIKTADLVIGSAGYRYNYDLTCLAIESGAHWIDLGGNNEVVSRQFTLDKSARTAGVGVIPDCGLAPGLVNIIAGHARERLDNIDELHFRVGGLPQHPKPPLFYSLVFSADGLANEYSEPARIIEKGKPRTVESLTGWERVHVGPPYGTLEAFHTSGGSSTMVDSFSGEVHTLDYKTLRYPGHMNRMRLLADLGFLDHRARVLPSGGGFIPREALGVMLGDVNAKVEDVVILTASASGTRNRRSIETGYRMIDHYDSTANLTAMARTTGFSAAIVARLLLEDKIRERGVLHQELSVPATMFFEMLNERGIVIEVSEKTIA